MHMLRKDWGKIGGRTLAVLATTAVVTAATAHDEDWRKLADRLPPMYGPIVRALPGTPAIAIGAQASSATGITLLSQVPLNNFGGFQSAGNDCWGYTSPSGREYAIMGLQAGFGFVEVTNPTNPVVIATIAGPNSTWHDIKVIGDYAYGVSEGGAGIQVIDLSNIDNGQVTLVRNSQQGGHSTTHNIVSNEEAGTLYLAGANIGNGGLIALDLTNPEIPQIAGGWTDMYVHDAQVVTWQSGPFAGREIAFCASGFNGGITQTGLRVVDMTDPSNPILLDTLFYPNSAYSHQVWITEDQQYLYLNDELDEQGGEVAVTTTRIIDISDLTNTSLVGTFTSGLPAIDHNLYVHEGLIYQANYRSGLRVFETSDPTAPTEVAFFDTFAGSDSAQFNGAWSVYPYFDSGTIIVSDIESGLFVLRVDAFQPSIAFQPLGSLPALVAAAGGDTIEVNVRAFFSDLDEQSVELVLTDAAGQSVVPGVANGDGDFAFTLPALACGDDVNYFFRATTTGGVAFSLPEDPQTTQFVASPVTGTAEVFSDDFETNNGWSVSGNAADGQWTRGVPVNAGRGDPPADADGSGSAFLTDNSAANGGNSDVDDGVTILTSPLFDTTGGAAISYSYWYDTFSTNSADDSLLVEVSFDGGLFWTIAAEHTVAALAWRDEVFTVDSADGSAQTRVRFTASDVGTQNVIEAGVDGFQVDRLLCESSQPCSTVDIAAPFGALTESDVLAFIASPFDFDADTETNFFDLLAFTQVFDTGCP